jgi:hypothetical protein
MMKKVLILYCWPAWARSQLDGILCIWDSPAPPPNQRLIKPPPPPFFPLSIKALRGYFGSLNNPFLVFLDPPGGPPPRGGVPPPLYPRFRKKGQNEDDDQRRLGEGILQ